MKKRSKLAEYIITVFGLALVAFCACEQNVFAATSPVLDQFSVALLGHTETVLETTTHGKTNAEILITPIQIGKLDGGYLAGIDAGVLGNVKPSSLGQTGFNWTAGVHFHLSPFLKKAASISPSYPALAGLEINPRVSYLFPNHINGVRGGWQFGLGLGWSWSATPQP